MPNLFLIPTPIAENGFDELTPRTLVKVNPLRYFAVENLKTARRFLRKMNFTANFDQEVQFFEYDKHTKGQNLAMVTKWFQDKQDIGLMSEAGLPCIADPGSNIVELAHSFGYTVVPLAGPSSIILALVASGLNGQNFAFNGYLPIEKADRIKRLQILESKVFTDSQTQLFMETPYRNLSVLEDIIKHCSPRMSLSLAADIGGEEPFILTKTIAEWKKLPAPDIHKKPAIFSLGLINK
jgi:16S rRNA (cytidine1402-2'-O)-methyltransferase